MTTLTKFRRKKMKFEIFSQLFHILISHLNLNIILASDFLKRISKWYNLARLRVRKIIWQLFGRKRVKYFGKSFTSRQIFQYTEIINTFIFQNPHVPHFLPTGVSPSSSAPEVESDEESIADLPLNLVSTQMTETESH